MLPRSYLPLPPKNISLNLLLYRQIPIVLQRCALDGIFVFPPYFHQFEPLSLLFWMVTSRFSAKHIPVDSCVGINGQLFLYLLLRQSLRPLIGELNNLFQGKITLFKPTSFPDADCTFMALVIRSLSALPLVTV